VASTASHTDHPPFSVRPFDRISALSYLGAASIFMVGGVHAQQYRLQPRTGGAAG